MNGHPGDRGYVLLQSQPGADGSTENPHMKLGPLKVSLLQVSK